jgi:hypothetical protein
MGTAQKCYFGEPPVADARGAIRTCRGSRGRVFRRKRRFHAIFCSNPHWLWQNLCYFEGTWIAVYESPK